MTVSNTSFAPVGVSYRLSPSDVDSQQPVTLALAYTDAAPNGTSPEVMTIAAQDDAAYCTRKAHAWSTRPRTRFARHHELQRWYVERRAGGHAANAWTKTWTFRLDPRETT